MNRLAYMNFNDINNTKKHYKLIMLVISSYDDIYNDMRKTWKNYMHKFDDVKIYFLHCKNDLETTLYVDENESTIYYKCEESLIPGIFLKSIHAMDYCQQTFNYDYLLRTNMSSLYNIPKLIDFLDNQPKTNFAGGRNEIYYNISFISGAGMIISKDLVEKMLTTIFTENTINHVFGLPDDVLLGYIINLHIDPSTYVYIPRFDIYERLTKERIESLSNDHFHFRNRNDSDLRVLDSQNINLLANYFYNV